MMRSIIHFSQAFSTTAILVTLAIQFSIRSALACPSLSSLNIFLANSCWLLNPDVFYGALLNEAILGEYRPDFVVIVSHQPLAFPGHEMETHPTQIKLPPYVPPPADLPPESIPPAVAKPSSPPLADPPANLQIIQIDIELSVADGSFIDVATLTPETPDTGGPLDLGPNITLDADGVLTYEAIWRYVETQVPIAVSETLPVTIHSLGRQGHAVFTGVGILKVEKLRGSLRLDHLAGPKQMTASGVLVFAPKVRNGLVIDENASMEFTVNGVSERLPSEVRLVPQQNRLAQKTTTGVFLTKQQSSIGALIGYFGDDCDGDCATEN